MLEDAEVSCPYCWETIVLELDLSAGSQRDGDTVSRVQRARVREPAQARDQKSGTAAALGPLPLKRFASLGRGPRRGLFGVLPAHARAPARQRRRRGL